MSIEAAHVGGLWGNVLRPSRNK